MRSYTPTTSCLRSLPRGETEGAAASRHPFESDTKRRCREAQLAFRVVASDTSTFLFADIAGFTALTEAHGDEHAVALVDDFAEAVKRELPPINGEHVKTIGDALMVRVPDPGDAVRLGLAITHDLPGGHEAP